MKNIVILLMLGNGFAQQFQAMLWEALAQNPKIQAEQLRGQSSLLRAESMRAWEAPALSAEWMNQSPLMADGLKLSILQSVPLGDKRRASADAEGSQSLVNQAQTQLNKLEFAQRFALVYTDLWLAEQQAKAWQEYRGNLEITQGIAELAVRHSGENSIQLLQIEELINAWQRDSLLYEGQIRNWTHELQSLRGLAGQPIAEPVELPQLQEFPALDTNKDNLWTHPLHAQSQVLGARKRSLDAANKPDLMLGMSYEKSWMNRDRYSLMAGITLPMVPWSRVGRDANRKEIDNEIKMLQFQIAEQKRQVELNWTQARSQDSILCARLQNITTNSLPRVLAIEKGILANYRQSKASLRDLREIWQSKIELTNQSLELQMQIQMNRWIWKLPSLIGEQS